MHYVADFAYFDVETETNVVEDSKGYRTPEYRKKANIMRMVNGITIKET